MVSVKKYEYALCDHNMVFGRTLFRWHKFICSSNGVKNEFFILLKERIRERFSFTREK